MWPNLGVCGSPAYCFVATLERQETAIAAGNGYCHMHDIMAEHQCFTQPHRQDRQEFQNNLEAKFLFFDFKTYVNNDC